MLYNNIYDIAKDCRGTIGILYERCGQVPIKHAYMYNVCILVIGLLQFYVHSRLSLGLEDKTCTVVL